MTAEVKLETTAEERAMWATAVGRTWSMSPKSVERLFRDIATLFAEVARISAQLRIANAEIVRLSASREEIREQLESEVARLKAECDAWIDLAAQHLRARKAELAKAQANVEGWIEQTKLANTSLANLQAEATAREATARAEERTWFLSVLQVRCSPHANVNERWVVDALISDVQNRLRSAP